MREPSQSTRSALCQPRRYASLTPTHLPSRKSYLEVPMEKWKVGVLLLGAFLLCVAFTPRSKADSWNHKTIVTFGDSVEIPGQILPAGTYVFKLMDSSDRHIVQIWTGDEQELIATVHSIPNQRMRPAEDTL